ncbi:MAG: UbiH/UbiF/VisC/COQ6 family ubiquinone biosynthesis hydroxylase [Chromatiales bacterium]|nr:UbiH/UbiF/VisC/COQ6 family ubiquinone biosynthesis hydroxylase [Chromatiales bacterium]
MSVERRCDVAIIGAGMVGAALAALLARGGAEVALIEGAPLDFNWPEGSTDKRVSALTVASERLLRHIGVWPRLADLGVSPFHEMHVWDGTGINGAGGEIHFDSADLGEPRLGHIVENRVIQRALIEHLRTCDSVSLHCPLRLNALTVSDTEVSLDLSDGSVISARLVVGADGASSRVRELAGLEVRGRDYGQHALVANVATEFSHRATAWQRFLPEGPLAFLPLRDGRSSIVWTMQPQSAEVLLAADDEAFCAELTRAFDARLGQVIASSPRAAFPLRMQYAPHYVAPRVALVGDAAHAIHPLAGQGANLGFLDAGALAETLIDALHAGHDPGARAVLRRYERWRKGDNLATMMAMDGFDRLFGSRLPPVAWARRFGLKLTDRALPLKNFLMRHAMGLHGDLPAVARGGMQR